MGRPRLPRDADGKIIHPPPKSKPEVAAAVPALGNPPPRMVDGRVNPYHFAFRMSEANELAHSHIMAGKPLPWNHDGYIKGIITEAKMSGVNIDDIAEHRTEKQQEIDGLVELCRTPNSAWNVVDAEIGAVLRGMNKVDTDTIAHVEDRFRALEGASGEEPDLLGKLQRLRTRLETILSLRDRARNPLPSSSWDGRAHQIRAAHLLRFMAYVGRSNIPSSDPAGTVFKFGVHHAKIAWDIYEAEHGIEMTWDHQEHRGVITEDRIPYIGIQIVCPLRHGKPLDVATPILMGNGHYKPLGLVSVGDEVISHTGTPRRVLAVHEQGILPTVRIATETGREVIAALDHPFLTPVGWVNAGELRVGQTLASVPNASCRSSPANLDECRLAGYFVGDGNTTANGVSENCRMSCAEPEVIERIEQCAKAMGFSLRIKPTKGKAKEILFSTNTAKPREWTKRIGISGKGSYEKRVPDFVWESGRDGIAAFLAGYFECDGTINHVDGIREDCCAEFYSVNRDLLVDTQRLLLRVGVRSILRLKHGRYRGKVHKSWRLGITSADAMARFIAVMPVIGPKRHVMDQWQPFRTRFEAQYIEDRIVSVSDAGGHECRCLTVEVDGTFTASDLVVHNSEIAAHYTARAICLRPEIQVAMLHAISSEAEKSLRYVASCFDKGNEVGRRCMALYPVELESSTNKRMKVKLSRPLKQPTMEAYGFGSSRLGINTDLQVWDDIVPRSDVEEETTRKTRFDQMGATWRSRQQGKKTFILSICTLWHHDDVNSRIIRLASDKSKRPEHRLMFRVSRQRCGGPRTTPKYYPLWPEMYGQAWLRQQAATLTPAMYSAAFESNPVSEEGRIVKQLRLYDPMTEAHAEFRSRAVFYISLDPSGVNRKGADKAGFVYAGMGEVTRRGDDGGNELSRTILRIMGAKQFNATQTDLVEFACGFSVDHKVDYVLTEQQGLSAIASIFEKYHGIAAISIPAGNKDKGLRLRRVAGMLDEAQTHVGGPCACVEFPGIRTTRNEDGTWNLAPDPEFRDVMEQILDYGVAADDGLLDATTQVCYYLMGQLSPGSGEVTRRVVESPAYSLHQQRLLDMLKDARTDTRKTAAEDDWEWSVKWNG